MTNQAFLGFMDVLDKRRFMHSQFFCQLFGIYPTGVIKIPELVGFDQRISFCFFVRTLKIPLIPGL